MTAAFALATSSLAAPSYAAETTQTTAAESAPKEEGSSDGEVAALVIGSIALVLALVGAGAFWAIQQGIISNPLQPAPRPQPQPQNRPRYGQACSWDEVLQPAQGPSGEWLICVASPSPTWVYGTEPLGVGTAREGEYCTRDGGQDSRGRMMMCLNNRWVYGP